MWLPAIEPGYKWLPAVEMFRIYVVTSSRDTRIYEWLPAIEMPGYTSGYQQ
jgi:hypothetical protein